MAGLFFILAVGIVGVGMVGCGFRKPRRKGLLWGGAVLLAGVVAANGAAYFHARAMMTYQRVGPARRALESLTWRDKVRVLFYGASPLRPETSGGPEPLALDAVELRIPVSDGVTLCAWYVDRGPEAALVVFFHGYSLEKTSLLREAKVLLQDGAASVMLVDFRGSGGSSESVATFGILEAEDVVAVCRYIEAEGFAHNRLVLYGFSMGAAAILRAVHGLGVTADALVLEAVFDSLLDTMRNRFRMMGLPSFPAAELLVFWGGRLTGINGFTHNPADYAADVEIPTLVLHGRRDIRARWKEGFRVYEALAGKKRFYLFETAGHESYLRNNPLAWRVEVGGFLINTLN